MGEDHTGRQFGVTGVGFPWGTENFFGVSTSKKKWKSAGSGQHSSRTKRRDTTMRLRARGQDVIYRVYARYSPSCSWSGRKARRCVDEKYKVRSHVTANLCMCVCGKSTDLQKDVYTRLSGYIPTTPAALGATRPKGHRSPRIAHDRIRLYLFPQHTHSYHKRDSVHLPPAATVFVPFRRPRRSPREPSSVCASR